jgi:hypothetical protein
MDQQLPVWHREVITEAVERVLAELERSSVLSPFYLAGGTGLALQLGHRRSQDLDFFSADLFEEDALVQRVQKVGGFSLTAKAPHTLHAVIEGVKVSFLGYAYPVLFPLKKFLGTRLADPRDIACMKISAIASRGTKRDFVDLFMLARELHLVPLLDLFHRKFTEAPYNTVHVLKSLTFFEDAEKDPDPDMLVAVPWQEVKQFFIREAARLP